MEKLRQMNELWFVVIQTPGDGNLANRHGHEGGNGKEEVGCCGERTDKSTYSLILSFFAYLSMPHIVISASYVLGTLADTLDKMIYKTWFLTMGKIKIRDRGE